MPPQFDHERLRVYQAALRFAVWVGPILEDLPSRLSAREQLDRASTSIVLNLAEGNGKRSHPDRCRYLDTARGSAVECVACLDVLVAREKCDASRVVEGKAILLEIVYMTAGLLARFGATKGESSVAEAGEEASSDELLQLKENE